MSREEIELTITPARIGFILSILSLLGIVFTAASLLMENRFRIENLERSRAEEIHTNELLNTKLDIFSDALGEFGLVLREIQTIQKQKDE